MSYIKENLMPNEKVMLTAQISPAVFIPSVFSFIFCIVMFILVIRNVNNQTPVAFLAMFYSCLAIFFLLYSFYLAAQAIIILFTTEFAVTNRRIFAKTGFIRRHTLELLLLKVESVRVQQNILARLLNYGTVTITGTGGTQERFRAIVDPLSIRRKINQVIENITAQTYSQ